MKPSGGNRKRVRSEADEAVPASVEGQDLAASRTTKKPRLEESRSLFVRSIPPDTTSESLTEFFSQFFPVKHAVVVVDPKTKQPRGFGFVTLADAEDAAEAKKTLDKKEWNGRRIRLEIAEPRHRNEAKSKPEIAHGKPRDDFQRPPKLIVRNLPWSIKTAEQLSRLFMSFGKIKFADLPSTKGQLKGFGFVTIRGRKNAEKALQAVNGKEVDGRTLAVDWAVDKEVWESQQVRTAGEDEAEESAAEAESEEPNETERAEYGKEKSKEGDESLEADLENFMKNHMQNLEEEDDSQEDGRQSDHDQDLTGNSKKLTTDNSSTVFVRNLPFTTTDEQLKTFFGRFGKIRYARVVFDKTTEKPVGTGFVCFKGDDDAKNCIKKAPRLHQPTKKAKVSVLQDESADPDGLYTLDGRLLQVAQAVNKEEANNLADSSLAKRNQKDKRRLFLLNEGSIGPSSSLYEVLTESEIQMRHASANQRKKLVQSNPTLHISLTRLALRNIPRDIGSKELKDLARKAVVGFAKDVKEGKRQPLSKEENARDGKEAKEKEHQRKLKRKGIIRQAKVVFESSQGSKVPEKSGAGKSRGYGFIEYTSHRWALMGLRYLNGYQLQGDNGKKQRLVVEFAIENSQVVQRRRATEGQSGHPSSANGGTAGKHSKETQVGQEGKAAKTKDAGEEVTSEGAYEAAKTKDAKLAMKQRLIARKRLTRKRKAKARG